MKKIKCDECKKINVYEKHDEFIYCSKCRKRIDLTNEKHGKGKLKYVLIILCSLVLISSISVLFLLRINQISKEIYVSEILKICEDDKECVLNKVIKKKILTIRKFDMKDVRYQSNKKQYTVKLKIGNKDKKLKFNIKDDVGAKIVAEYCEFNPNENIDLKLCVKIDDFIDGNISLDDNKVQYDISNVDNTKEGKYYVTFLVKDSSNIEIEEDIEVSITNVKSRAIEVISSKEHGNTDEQIVFSINWTPGNTYDKTVIWETTRDDGVVAKMDSNVFSVSSGGVYKVCAITNDTKVKACKEITISPTCKNTYIFNYDGGYSPRIDIGSKGEVCPGTYQIYATQLNYHRKSIFNL